MTAARAWEFRHPNGLRVARPYGPVTHQPELLPEGSDSIEGMGVIADLIEALAVFQDRTTTQITVPDFAKLTMLEARPILHTADLIRGAAVTVPWEGITIHVHPGVDAIARLRLPTHLLECPRWASLLSLEVHPPSGHAGAGPVPVSGVFPAGVALPLLEIRVEAV